MRPRSFTSLGDAIRWSRLGGVALYRDADHPQHRPALYGSAQNSESVGWSKWWAGKFGADFLEVLNRNTAEQAIALTDFQAAQVATQCGTGITCTSLLTTVVYFTGTREGLTEDQRESLREWLFVRNVIATHDGLCIGADEEFHGIAESLAADRVSPYINGWPAIVPADLTCINRVKCHSTREPRPPLDRNTAMAEDARDAIKWRKENAELVACPAGKEKPSSDRGSTWHAIGRFQSRNVPVTIINPDGSSRHV